MLRRIQKIFNERSSPRPSRVGGGRAAPQLTGAIGDTSYLACCIGETYFGMLSFAASTGTFVFTSASFRVPEMLLLV